MHSFKKLVLIWTIGLICIGISFSKLNFIQSASLKISDSVYYFCYLRATHYKSPHKIILISIDDYSLRNIPLKWPWKRSVYAQILDILDECQTNTVAFDVVFSGSSLQSSEDIQFVNSLKKFKGKIILAYFIDKEGKPVYPGKEFMKNCEAIGFLNTPLDKDNKIRFARAYLKLNEVFCSFPVEIARLYPYTKDIKIEGKEIWIGKTKISLTEKATFPIKYKFKLKDIPSISFYDVLKGNFSKDIFKNALVFIAPTSEIIHDTHYTPLGRFPGALIHINAVFNILEGETLKLFPKAINLAVAFILIVISGWVIYYFSFLRNVILCGGIVLILFWLSVFLYTHNYLLPFGDFVILLGLHLGLGNIYKYISFVSLLTKIKNKSIIEPLTGFFVPRYFYYRVNVEATSFYLYRYYIVLLYIQSLHAFFKDKDISFIKDFWRNLKSILESQSKLWTLYQEDMLAGLIRTSSKNIDFLMERLKFSVEEFLQEQGVEGMVKIGVCLFNRKLSIRDLLTFLSLRLKETKERLVIVSPQQVPSSFKKELNLQDVLEFLDKDIEEKNRELIKLVEKLKNEQKKVEEAYFELITSLIKSLEAKDPYTEGHTQRVCEYAVMLAQKLNLPLEEIDRIRKAALLHDLGKIGIPDSILHKKGKLTPEEFNMIKQHEIVGAKILEHIKEFKDIIPYILYHHERFDGTGYPYGLAGDMIPLGAQIIAIADAFDAMITGRDYKKAYTIKEAVQELEKNKGSQFNPHLVDSFIKALKERHLL